MTTPLMKCGHSANSTDTKGNPVCVICIGIVAGADEIVKEPPSLEGRFARCSYGDHAKVPSSYDLAFFEYRPEREEDTYYCGCYGWD
jgi:hypothetical protein